MKKSYVLLASIVVIGVGGIALATNAMKSEKIDFNEDAVTAVISATSPECSSEFPLAIGITNISDKDTLSVGFVVEVTDAGHSTEYYSDIIGSDRIIPPGHTYQDCFRMPSFNVGDTYPRTANGIPYSLANPQYQVEVTGVKLRGEP